MRSCGLIVWGPRRSSPGLDAHAQQHQALVELGVRVIAATSMPRRCPVQDEWRRWIAHTLWMDRPAELAGRRCEHAVALAQDLIDDKRRDDDQRRQVADELMQEAQAVGFGSSRCTVLTGRAPSHRPDACPSGSGGTHGAGIRPRFPPDVARPSHLDVRPAGQLGDVSPLAASVPGGLLSRYSGLSLCGRSASTARGAVVRASGGDGRPLGGAHSGDGPPVDS